MEYLAYCSYIKSVCDTNDVSNFKANPTYRGILEHVSPEIGTQYLDAINEFTPFTLEDIKGFCTLNDTLGSPLTSDYTDFVSSPSNLRYIFHSHLILSHLQSLGLPHIDIVEVGGGYGGLCLALHHFAEKYSLTIRSYTIIDLAEPLRLQKLYLSQIHPYLTVDFVDASTFGAGISTKDMFLISNYCFSELPAPLQKEYRTTLFLKVSHGFMTWNWIPLYNFGFTVREETEFPKTGSYNKYLYF
jgi:hypothetical protein